MFGTVWFGGAYAELHCHTNFSFLDGASHPEELAVEAARLGLAALAVTDHDGFYGVGPLRARRQEHGLPTVFGTELTLGITAARRTASPIRRVSTSWCSRRGRPDTPASHGRSARRRWRGRRARPAPRSRARRRRACAGAPPSRSRARTTTRGSCSPAVGRAPFRRRSCATGRPRRAPRSTSSSPRSGAIACSWSCGTTAIRSTVTATTRWPWSRWRRGST